MWYFRRRCNVSTVSTCVCVHASCHRLQETILQGAVLSHTCSVSFIAASLLSHLICRDATRHTYLIWLLQGKAPRLEHLLEPFPWQSDKTSVAPAVSWTAVSQSPTTTIAENTEAGHAEKSGRRSSSAANYLCLLLCCYLIVGKGLNIFKSADMLMQSVM